MLNDNDYKVIKMHICSFERKNGMLTFDMQKYPERLCVFDRANKIVIDVETGHQYPYVKVLYQKIFCDIEEVKTLMPDKRVGCVEYSSLFCDELDENTLKRCKNIIKQLKKGIKFPNGNEELTNEQYLDMINNHKYDDKVKKIGRKRK